MYAPHEQKFSCHSVLSGTLSVSFFLFRAAAAKASAETNIAKAVFTLSSVAVTGIIFVGSQLRIRIFLLCIPLLPPLSLPVNNTVATKVKTRYAFMFRVPRYVTAKRD